MMYNVGRILQEVDKEVVFRATKISGDGFLMKRFNQQTPDFPVSHLAGTVFTDVGSNFVSGYNAL